MTITVQLTQGTLMFFGGIGLMGMALAAGGIFAAGKGRRKRRMEEKMRERY